MRRWLPLALLVALAALAWLVLRDGERRDPIARTTPDAPAAAPVEAQPAEFSARSSSGEQRADLAPKPVDPVPAAAGTGSALLTLRIVGKMSREPMARVRVRLSQLPAVDPRIGSEPSAGNHGDPEHEPITGSDGLATFDLPAERAYAFFAFSEDQSAGSIHGELGAMSAGERRELVVELPDELDGQLFGRVVVGGTEEPVAGAKVRVLPAGQTRREWIAADPSQVLTDNDGRFVLRFTTWRDQNFCVEAAGFGLRYVAPGRQHTDLAQPLIVRLSRSATLHARLLDAAGAPISDAWVDLSCRGFMLTYSEFDAQGFVPGGFSFPPDETWRGRTDANGRAEIVDLPPAVTLNVDLTCPGAKTVREPASLRLQPGETAEREWRIGGGTSVRGLVLDQDSRPVGALTLWITRARPDGGRRYFVDSEAKEVARTATTDPDGRFTLADLGEGAWDVGPRATNTADAVPVAERLEVHGEPLLDWTLHVTRGLYVRGKVLAPSGEPVPKAWINCIVSSGMQQEGAQSESDGSFRYGPLVPGPLNLCAYAFGRFAESKPVETHAGEEGVILRLEPAGSMSGRVLDAASGAPVACAVFVTPAQRTGGVLGSGMMSSTGEDGRFDFSGLAQGRWAAAAISTDGRVATVSGVNVVAGAESVPLELRVAPGARLRLVYRGEKPRALVTILSGDAALMFPAPFQRDKSVDCFAPAGTITIELRDDCVGPARTRTVEVKAGETKELTLTDEE